MCMFLFLGEFFYFAFFTFVIRGSNGSYVRHVYINKYCTILQLEASSLENKEIAQ